MFEWIGNVVDAVVDFFTGGSDDPPSEPDPCDVGDCLEAKAELESARSGVQSACLWLGITLAPLRTATYILGLPLPVLILTLVLAIVFGGPLGGFIAVLIYFFLVLFVRGWLPVINAVVQTLTSAYTAEREAIQRVVTECPEACHDDTELSDCPHTDWEDSLPSTWLDGFLGRT